MSKYREKIVKVRVGDYADPEQYSPQRRKLIDMKLEDYLKEIVSTEHDGKIPPPYAGNFSLPMAFLENLLIGCPTFFDKNRYEPPTVWLGAKGSITPLHKDSTDNFARQITGRKKWVIFPPQDAHFLYLKHNPASVGGDFATSDVDLRRIDHEKFPDFPRARSYTFELAAGQILYLPAGWSHFVENLETSLMINYWLSTEPSGIYALDQI
jgi:hypothetical protein